MKARSTDYHLHLVLEALFRPSWEGSIAPPCMCNGIAGFKGKFVKSSRTHFIEHLLQDLCHTHLLSLIFDFSEGVNLLSPGF